MKHAPRTMWKGKGLSKAAGQCNGLQDYGFCDLKDCKAIQSFRRDVRSITGATYKGMLKRDRLLSLHRSTFVYVIR
ncbi:uncharacterized protein [Temnothorax nylanderi]